MASANTTESKKNYFQRFIVGIDRFGDSPASRLHFNGLEKHKSHVGGYCTLIMIISIITIIIIIAIPILTRNTPYNTSITVALD